MVGILDSNCPRNPDFQDFILPFSSLNRHSILQEDSFSQSTDEETKSFSSMIWTIMKHCLLSSEVLDPQINRNLQKASFSYRLKYYCTFQACRQQASLMKVHSWYSKLCRDYSICSKYIRGFKILIVSTAVWEFLYDWKDAMNRARPSLLLALSRNIYGSS